MLWLAPLPLIEQARKRPVSRLTAERSATADAKAAKAAWLPAPSLAAAEQAVARLPAERVAQAERPTALAPVDARQAAADERLSPMEASVVAQRAAEADEPGLCVQREPPALAPAVAAAVAAERLVSAELASRRQGRAAD